MSRKVTDFEQARVASGEQMAGRLERTSNGSRFVYEGAFLDVCRARGWGVGFKVPMQPVVETPGVGLHSFFAGLLPEGIRLEALTKSVKTSPDDFFTLVLYAGAETIGDVRVLAIGPRGVIGPVEPVLSIADFKTASFARALAESLDYSKSTEQFSIPGVQPKISAQMLTLPLRGPKHVGAALLKLQPPKAPRLVQNEAFFMRAADACGLDVATSELVRDKEGETGLLVKRFDRLGERRLHVEDGCQLLNRYPADKYRVSFQELAAEVARLVNAVPLEMLKLCRLLGFSYLIGNGDLHARNVSIIVNPNGRRELSPAYDLLSTLPYGDRKLALKVLGRDDNLKRDHFHELVRPFGVQPRALDVMLDSLCTDLEPWVDRLEEIGLDEKKTSDLRRTMKKRLGDLAKPIRSQ